ncbi:MAG TPA: PLP-dependent aspartate aminotransferase family protein [Anaerolineae bacterium]|nr:PLP-dependent aspartate aminotransferase family protein [Anaerolineae bacterium]HOQ97407.1 PLP-dependent aspartate aminotransferase family protein [Anaerolineae bacterium]HPL30156.1 PLP-dependent aspartate aminotransferase family protein [Anaerolineae bacterium]
MAKWKYSKKPAHAELRKADPRYADKALETQCLHAGERWEKQDFWTSSTPIYNGTEYFYDTIQERDDRVYYRKPGYTYSRGGSPTSTALERAISTLEGADATHVCASGMAASHLALLTAGAGKEGMILCSSDVYGSVYTMIENIFPALGTHTMLMEMTDLDKVEDTIRREKPAIVYFEAVTNPLTKVVDAPAVIDIAHRYGAAVIVDNTFTTPYLFKPFTVGAAYVTHSVSKYLSGHADVLAGSVSCHLENFDRLRDMLIQTGCSLGPNEAFLALRGIKTFALRMERHCANAMAIARFLESHPLIERVRYPGLASHPQHDVAKRILRGDQFGGMVSFDIAGCDKAKAFRFMDALKVVMASTSLGDVFSICIHPATSTHHWLNDEELAALGIGWGTMRMSVGVENVEDIKDDLDQALKACR